MKGLKKSKRIEKARNNMNSFSARDSKCPCCGKDFREGCGHSVTQAKDKLFERYIQALNS